MRVLIYAEASSFIKISGIGCAISHQKQALEEAGLEYTDNIKDDYDVIHINTYGLMSRHLAKKSKKQGKAVVYHAHSTEEDFRNSFVCSNLISKLFRKWITSCYNLGDVIVTPTDYSKRLIEGYGVKRPVYAVSNGIDKSFYIKRENDRADFRKRFGYSDTDKVIMSVGLFIERKGILDFVEMAKRLPQYKFIWFGKTPLISVPHKIRKAVHTKLPNLCFAGFIAREELKKAYHGADLFAFLTHEETEGIVLLEALASKTQTLIRDIPIYTDKLANGKNVYKASGNTEIERKITDILEGRLENVTSNGYEVLDKKDIATVGHMLKAIYIKAMKIHNK